MEALTAAIDADSLGAWRRDASLAVWVLIHSRLANGLIHVRQVYVTYSSLNSLAAHLGLVCGSLLAHSHASRARHVLCLDSHRTDKIA